VTHNASENRPEGARVRVPPPLAFVAAIVGGWFVPGIRMRLYLLPALLALLLIASGLALGGSAFLWFRRTGQDARPWKPSPSLIGVGPYRFTRNPMYVGMTLVTVGIGALAERGWICALAFVALAFVHFTAVLPEERYLGAKFGADYIQYMRRVGRYF
jgi:protein-S-isoprenylcysteine O-methyltransferase Ste14